MRLSLFVLRLASVGRQCRAFRRIVPLLLACLVGGATASIAGPVLEPGARLDSLPVGQVIYRDVVIRSINARTVVFTHSGGMTSLRLRDLAPEWQARFGYNARADSAAEASLNAAAAASAARAATAAANAERVSRVPRTPATSKFDEVIREFGQPVTIESDVDLRPKFFQLELGVKNQGRRPSCAVFAVVSALEFENAELAGKPERFSEEYLVWATRKTIQRPADAGGPPPDAEAEDADAGFALLEVVSALRGYGIPLQSSMPNTYDGPMGAITEPPPEIIDEARTHQRVFIHLLPGRDNATRLSNLVHVLNAGIPVPVGLGWPYFRSVRGGYLSAQPAMPGASHAVTLVGYRCPTHRLEDVVFIFKNSWGMSWGQGGYGFVTYPYLLQHLNSAVLIEVQRG